MGGVLVVCGYLVVYFDVAFGGKGLGCMLDVLAVLLICVSCVNNTCLCGFYCMIILLNFVTYLL